MYEQIKINKYLKNIIRDYLIQDSKNNYLLVLNDLNDKTKRMKECLDSYEQEKINRWEYKNYKNLNFWSFEWKRHYNIFS
jgi:hypothetical protein